MQPETRYAKSGDVSIAYQVVGEGPFDLVLIPGFVSNVEYAWEEPSLVSLYEQLASFCRLIVFDKRGTGLSDRVGDIPTLETRMDDVRAVMDASGSERAALIGYSEGASMAVLFATTYPERTPALIMYGSFLAWDWLAEGQFPTRHHSPRAALEEIERRWGTPDYCEAGIAVHTGARVASHAQPGEVLVSSTVKDLVAGSGLAFEERGEHELKGIPGEWRLYAVEL